MITAKAEHFIQACRSDTWPWTSEVCSYVGVSPEISITLGCNHAKVVRLQGTEMGLYVLKRSGDFRCLSRPGQRLCRKPTI